MRRKYFHINKLDQNAMDLREKFMIGSAGNVANALTTTFLTHISEKPTSQSSKQRSTLGS